MARQQPKWAWWVVGIVVPIVVAAIPYLLLQQARTSEAPANTPDAHSASGLEESPEARARGKPARPSSSSKVQPAAPSDAVPTPAEAKGTQPPGAPTQPASADPQPTSDVASKPIARRANKPLTSYTIKHGEVISLSDPAVSLSVSFDRVLSQDVLTFIAAGGGETQRAPVMSAGTTVDLVEPNSNWRATILAIDWARREATINLINRATRHVE